MTSMPNRVLTTSNACVLCGFLLLLIVSACKRENELGHPVSFSTSPIYDDCKRIPLAFPFEITDSYGNVQFNSWEYYVNPSKDPVEANSPMSLTHIMRFAQTNDYLFGEHDTGWVTPSGELRYFVLSLANTNLLFISDRKDFVRHCATFGGDTEQMRPFEEQWKAYWEQHDKRIK